MKAPTNAEFGIRNGSPVLQQPLVPYTAASAEFGSRYARVRRCRGGTLLLALGCVALLAVTAAYTLQRVSPRYRQTAQFAAWQEAHLAAEAGVDIAIADLQKNAVGPIDGAWAGWQQNGPNHTVVPATPATLSQFTPASYGNPQMGNGLLGKLVVSLGLQNLLGITTNGNGNAFGIIGKGAKNGSGAGTADAGLGSPVIVSDPIYLDNNQAAQPGNRPTNVDVQLWAVYPTPSPYYRWFRIRSMATCAIPVVATTSAPDRLDNVLRRYSLRTVRPQLKQDDVGTPMTVPTPNTSRVIEVLVEPLLPFEMAILTQSSLSLATSGAWKVDSYDSSDPAKSDPNGLYQPSKAQSNAAIGSNATCPVQSPYGPLVALNGTAVRGTIATNGGDDPSTQVHENVSGATKVDPSQVRDDFYRDLPLFSRPVSGIFLTPPAPGKPFVAGTLAAPAVYLVSDNLQAFDVAPPAPNTAGALTIAVNGDLDVPTGTIKIPTNVVATIYVRGNVDFHDRPINADGTPAQMQIYGEDSQGAARTVKAFGNANISAAFYGPQYDVQLMDNVTWCGAIAARSFTMLGGGAGGFHYDEALGMVGAPIGFRIARYIEDVRE
jgi:hypothetical protein